MKFKTRDGETFEVDYNVAVVSGFIKNMIDILGVDKNHQEILHLRTIDSQIFEKVLQWMERHRDKHHHEHRPKQEKLPSFLDVDNGAEVHKSDTIPEWDLQFFQDMPFQNLMTLATAANFLQIDYLTSLINMYTAKLLENRRKQNVMQFLKNQITRKCKPTEESAEEIAKNIKKTTEKQSIIPTEHVKVEFINAHEMSVEPMNFNNCESNIRNDCQESHVGDGLSHFQVNLNEFQSSSQIPLNCSDNFESYSAECSQESTSSTASDQSFEGTIKRSMPCLDEATNVNDEAACFDGSSMVEQVKKRMKYD